MINVKSDKGITLMMLTIYIIVISIVMAILINIVMLFNNNITIVKNGARYAASFDKFNDYFLKDVKNNKKALVQTEENGQISIIFEDGTRYKYIYEDKGIYKENIKIASNIDYFNASSKKIIVSDTEKEIITINIAIGTDKQRVFDKTIDYTLRYW